jgi:uncharacterized protein (DUF4415 family)
MKKLSERTVRMTRSEMKPLSKKQLANLRKLATLPDSEINLKDIPEIKELPPDYVIGKFYRPKKTNVSIRIDADVLAWLKAQGDGYQTRINGYLRQLMREKGQSRQGRVSLHS